MKKRKLIFILLLLFIMSSVGFFLTNRLMAKDTEEKIYNLANGSIVSINISAQESMVKLESKDGKWEMTEPAGCKTDEDAAENLAKKLENLTALRVIEKKAKNLSSYGLDKPQLTVDFKLKEGKTKTLLVGEEAASKFQAYVKDSESDAVYTLTMTDIDIFGKGNPSAFRDRNFLSIDKTKVNLLSLVVDGKQNMMLEEYEAGKWQFVKPCKVNAKNDAVKEILKGILGLKIKDFVDVKSADLSRYRLDFPEFIVEVGDKDGKSQLISYGLTDDKKKEAYISLGGEDGVFIVSTQEFDPKSLAMGDLLNETPLSIAIDRVKTVRIIDGGMQYEFKRNDLRPQEDIFNYKGSPADKENFIAMYVDLMALTSDGYDASNAVRKPELSVIYESKAGNDTVRLDLSKRDDRSYFLTVDGEPLPFYVTSQKVDLVRRWIVRAAEISGG